MIAIGIDYSMTCPAACLIDSEWTSGEFDEHAPRFWFGHERKTCRAADVQFDVIFPGTVIDRAERNARSLIAWLCLYAPSVKTVAIEDYAFSATGRVFHIGEHTGILKYLLEKSSISFVPVSPTAVKKFATGKGNADKQKMTNAFLNAYPPARAWITDFFPRTICVDTAPAKSPLSDLADAYWIANYAASR